MEKKIVIKGCGGCPHVAMPKTDNCICTNYSATGNIIITDLKSIPEWCPLENN